jgi:hypothetical protein
MWMDGLPTRGRLSGGRIQETVVSEYFHLAGLLGGFTSDDAPVVNHGGS